MLCSVTQANTWKITVTHHICWVLSSTVHDSQGNHHPKTASLQVLKINTPYDKSQNCFLRNWKCLSNRRKKCPPSLREHITTKEKGEGLALPYKRERSLEQHKGCPPWLILKNRKVQGKQKEIGHVDLKVWQTEGPILKTLAFVTLQNAIPCS